jgi:hypothetical protein
MTAPSRTSGDVRYRERLGKSRRRLIANAARNPGDGVVARFEPQHYSFSPGRYRARSDLSPGTSSKNG